MSISTRVIWITLAFLKDGFLAFVDSPEGALP